MTNNPRVFLKMLVLIIVVSVIGSYAYDRTREFVAGPSIVISSPLDGAVLDSPYVKITGEAQNISHIVLNGRQIFTNEAGVFDEPLLLYPGYNIISVQAKDRFDRTVEKRTRLMVNAPQAAQIYNIERSVEVEQSAEEVESFFN